MKKCLILVFLLAFGVAYQIGCSAPTPAPSSNNANPPASTPTPTVATGQEPEEPMATSAEQSPHCGDNPPANPSNCDINKPFSPGCKLPWTGEQRHEIDQRCPNEGCAKRDSDIAQNKIKNNLCAAGTPVQISVDSIDKLQVAVDQLVQQGKFSYGKTGPPQPADRAKLQGLSTVDSKGKAVTLGEGKLVTIEAFVFDAKHDDTFPFGFKGEGVNCKNSLFDWNDIHVALTDTASAKECSSVTAEITPHFRPAVWDRFDSNTCTAPHVTKPLPIKDIRVRITGQLFFDGSHTATPCGAPGGGGNPVRRSVWEIHPAYAIQVFDPTKKKFVTLEQWAKGK